MNKEKGFASVAIILGIIIILGILGGWFIFYKNVLPNQIGSKVLPLPTPAPKYEIIYSDRQFIRPSFYMAEQGGLNKVTLEASSSSTVGYLPSPDGKYVAKLSGGVSGGIGFPKNLEISSSQQILKPGKVFQATTYDAIDDFIWSSNSQKFIYIVLGISDINNFLKSAKHSLYIVNKDGSNNTKTKINIPVPSQTSLKFKLLGFDANKNIIYGILTEKNGNNVAQKLVTIDLSNGQQKTISTNGDIPSVLTSDFSKGYLIKQTIGSSNINGYSVPMSNQKIVEINLSNGTEKELFDMGNNTNPQNFSISTDNNYLSFVEAPNSSKLYLFNLKTNKPDVLLEEPTGNDINTAAWSPDSKYLFVGVLTLGNIPIDKTKGITNTGTYYTISLDTKQLTPFYQQGPTESSNTIFNGWLVR